MHLLVTRPSPGAEKTAEKLKALGHRVTVQSLSTIEPTGTSLPPVDISALAVTSATAFRAIPDIQPLTHLPVYCVGDATAAAAKAAGFGDITSASGNAENLFELLLTTEHGLTAPVLYACAEQKSFDLQSAMQDAGRKCVDWTVYRAAMLGSFSGELVQIIKNNQIDAVLFYSARTAKHFAHLCQQHGLERELVKFDYYCLSLVICSKLPTSAQNRCFAPETPTETALLGLLPQN